MLITNTCNDDLQPFTRHNLELCHEKTWFFSKKGHLNKKSLTLRVMIILYYSKFAKGQNFNFVCRRSCVSDTKNFMIDM